MTESVQADLGALTEEECLRYLAAPGLGRLAVSVRALPAILPVRFVLDRGEILFRVRLGSVLAAGTERTVVAFEADGNDRADGAAHAWSVVATGLASHVEPNDARHQSTGRTLRHWSADGTDVLVALTPKVLTGWEGPRRLVVRRDPARAFRAWHDEHRARCVVDDLLAHRAEQQSLEPASSRLPTTTSQAPSARPRIARWEGR